MRTAVEELQGQIEDLTVEMQLVRPSADDFYHLNGGYERDRLALAELRRQLELLQAEERAT